MIEIVDLTKRYGQTVALDRVTLSINPGEVVGLLGPNGAGKSSMLKILTGYLPPTDGTARVDGENVLDQSLSIRSKIGYLPETNPLYEDLAVYESMEWTARLRGMPDTKRRRAIDKAIAQCGLSSVVGKDVAHLSKGFRQRLGLAQAILHDPDILILDEPTSGLDPNQQAEMRALIQTLKQKKTVLLSTHILSEAQAACDRVIIIHRGKIAADGAPDTLSKDATAATQLVVEWKAPVEAAHQKLQSLEGVQAVRILRTQEHSARFQVAVTPGLDVRETIFHVATSEHWPILHLSQESGNLEDVFRQLTLGGSL